MLHPDLERANRKLDREKAERELIDYLVEQFYESWPVNKYVGETLDSYQLDFDRNGVMTHEQEELICQYQNVIYVQIISGMLRRITGRD